MRFLLTGGTINPLKDEYLNALARLGHEGDIIYPREAPSDMRLYDALLLPGGADIDPARFNAALLPNHSETVDPARDGLEFALFERFVLLGKPVFGICRGIQVINVALGGTLWQDLPSQCGRVHASAEGSPPQTHTVFLTGTPQVVQTNSYHHQAVRTTGKGLQVTGRSADGVIEAIEHQSLPIRAVQWHPEKGGFGIEYLLEGID